MTSENEMLSLVREFTAELQNQPKAARTQKVFFEFCKGLSDDKDTNDLPEVVKDYLKGAARLCGLTASFPRIDAMERKTKEVIIAARASRPRVKARIFVENDCELVGYILNDNKQKKVCKDKPAELFEILMNAGRVSNSYNSGFGGESDKLTVRFGCIAGYWYRGGAEMERNNYDSTCRGGSGWTWKITGTPITKTRLDVDGNPDWQELFFD